MSTCQEMQQVNEVKNSVTIFCQVSLSGAGKWQNNLPKQIDSSVFSLQHTEATGSNSKRGFSLPIENFLSATKELLANYI